MHRSQVDDSFAVGPRAGNPLGSHFADEETVTGASNIFFPWRCILDWLQNNGDISKQTSNSDPFHFLQKIPSEDKSKRCLSQGREKKERHTAWDLQIKTGLKYPGMKVRDGKH